MIVKRGYRTYEEAAEEANALLWKNRESREQLTTTEHTRLDENDKRLPFAYIEDKETGATAYIYAFHPEESGYSITFLSGDEAKEENRTYPYRGTPKESIPFLMALHTPIFKPVREITPDEALTPDGLREIYAFFGYDVDEAKFTYGFQTKEEVEAKAYTIETAFETIVPPHLIDEGASEEELKEGEIEQVNCIPFPQALTELTGVKIKKPSDYVKGISKLLKAELSEQQEKEILKSLLFYTSEALLRYAIYEFFRTEDYSHLKEVLSSFKKFYLPQNWEEDFTLYYGYRNMMDKEYFTTEEYVLAKYLSKWNANLVGLQARLKDVAEYTGTPIALMSKANRIKHIWDF